MKSDEYKISEFNYFIKIASRYQEDIVNKKENKLIEFMRFEKEMLSK
jgi:hypothetical protein